MQGLPHGDKLLTMHKHAMVLMAVLKPSNSCAVVHIALASNSTRNVFH